MVRRLQHDERTRAGFARIDVRLEKLWDAETGGEVATWNGYTHSVNFVAISPDGKRALSGSEDNTLKLWDVEANEELDAIVVDGRPTNLAVRGDLALVGNRNTTVTVYRLK